MTERDKDMLTKYAASWLAQRGAEKRREPIKAKARQMCAEMNKPVPECLR